MHLVQMCVQGRWISDSSLLTLPHIEETHVLQMNRALAQSTGARDIRLQEVACLAELLAICEHDSKFLPRALEKSLSKEQISQVQKLISHKHTLLKGGGGHIFESCDIPFKNTPT